MQPKTIITDLDFKSNEAETKGEWTMIESL